MAIISNSCNLAQAISQFISAGDGINVNSLTNVGVEIAGIFNPNYISGFLMSYDSIETVRIADGFTVDSTNQYNVILLSALIDIGVTGVSGIDVGTASSDLTYFTYIISDSTGAQQPAPIASLDAVSPSFANAPGYDLYRKIPSAAFQTDNSANIMPFIQTTSGTYFNVNATTKVLTTADANTLQICNNAATQTITVPLNTSTSLWKENDTIQVYQQGAGQIVFTTQVGVTIQSVFSNLKIAAQFTSATLIFLGSDTWKLEGNLTA